LWIENHLIPYLIGGNTTKPLEKRDLEEFRLDDLGLVASRCSLLADRLQPRPAAVSRIM
jgi:hypothetical protein